MQSDSKIIKIREVNNLINNKIKQLETFVFIEKLSFEEPTNIPTKKRKFNYL